MRIPKTTAAFLAFCGILLASAPIRAKTPAFEVMHWWNSASEAAAINEIRRAFEARGHRWIDRSMPSYTSMRAAAMDQISAGFPPAAMQWLAGPDLNDLSDLQLIMPTEPLAQQDGWHERMYPFVADLAGHHGEFVALPVSIHAENWAYFSRSVYDTAGLPVPSSWRQLIEQAPAILDAGFIPLAVGGGSWQLRILFSSIVLGTAGREAFETLLLPDAKRDLEAPEMREAFDIFLALRAFVDVDHIDRSWHDATALVVSGQAAVQFMGDWAKGEFVAAGQRPEIDYVCQLAPGTGDAYVTIVDFFLLGMQEDPALAEAQTAFARTVVSPEVQTAFARHKGSIPVLRDVSARNADLDECSREAMATLRKPGAFLASANHFDNGSHVAKVNAAIRTIWMDPSMNAERAAAYLNDAIRD
ncbi:MAG: ABC transporter substrate-binding protein [Pseudomonadota bacterium]